MASSSRSTGQLYPYELVGNTLVVRPHGDSVGFGIHQLRIEVMEVRKMAQEDRVRHLLVDLSEVHYFGSMVLGDLVEFANIVKSRGGRVGLCGASSDMLAVMNLTHQTEFWELFPDLAAGLRTVATIPLSERLWQYRQAALVTMGVIAFGVAVIFWPRSPQGAAQATELVELWDDFHNQQSPMGDEERYWFAKRIGEKVQPIVDDLEQLAKKRSLSPVERSTLFTARAWIHATEKRGEAARQQFVLVQNTIDDLRKHLQGNRELSKTEEVVDAEMTDMNISDTSEISDAPDVPIPAVQENTSLVPSDGAAARDVRVNE